MTVLYRKYRPQTVSELDSKLARKQLTDLLNSGRVPHAFLFSGPKGTGKTSTARIIAKAINCPNRKKGEIEPCNKCESCISVTNGSNLDILEIDGASNRGIDEIRDLREKIKLAPAFCKYKVYIIDEVHMLTNEAFNALLKTLEEPPPHAIFILCTTEAQKLPETITSRCQQIIFKRATTGDLIDSLKRAARGEGFNISDEVLQLIAKKAGGSFRDGQKILDQLSQGNDFSQKAFNLLFSSSTEEDFALFYEKLIRRDRVGALVIINKIASSDMQLDDFLNGFLDYLRMILITKAGAGTELIKPEISEEVFARVEKEADALSLDELRKLVDLIGQAKLKLRDAVIQKLPLEIAVVEWCGEGRKELGDRSLKLEEEKNKEGEKGKTEEKEKGEEERPSFAGASAGEEDTDSFEKIKGRWPEVLKKVKPYNHSVEALLRAARPFEFDGKILTLEVFYKFHKDKIDKEPARSLVEKAIEEACGIKVRVRCVMGEKPKVKSSIDNVNEVVVNDDPLVKAAEEIFLS